MDARSTPFRGTRAQVALRPSAHGFTPLKIKVCFRLRRAKSLLDLNSREEARERGLWVVVFGERGRTRKDRGFIDARQETSGCENFCVTSAGGIGAALVGGEKRDFERPNDDFWEKTRRGTASLRRPSIPARKQQCRREFPSPCPLFRGAYPRHPPSVPVYSLALPLNAQSRQSSSWHTCSATCRHTRTRSSTLSSSHGSVCTADAIFNLETRLARARRRADGRGCRM